LVMVMMLLVGVVIDSAASPTPESATVAAGSAPVATTAHARHVVPLLADLDLPPMDHALVEQDCAAD